ncbi:hypothetical protein ACFQZC_08945 [Streptacidiphilus monticola]
MALTGRNRRWEDEDGRNVQQLQQDGWRNLHHEGESRLDLRLLVPGRTEPLAISRVWTGPAWTDCSTQVTGLGPDPLPLTALGWEEDLRSFRPILSYSELGQLMTAKPAQMYDRLASLLGLGALAEAQELLADREKELGENERQAKAALPALQDRLAATADERARAAEQALAARIPDREQIRALVTGTPPADAAELARLRRYSTLEGPDPDAVAAAVALLREALAGAEDHRFTEAGAALERADLLDRALRLRQRHPKDHTCPVCASTDRLDDDWAAAAVVHIETLHEQAQEAERVRRELRTAAGELRAMAHRRPSGLPEALHPLWDDWDACRSIQDHEELAANAEKRASALAAACRQIRDEAARRLAELDEQWQALVPELASWLSAADAAVDAKPVITRIRKARDWLKACQAELRAERMRAIASAAQDIWQYLCQESNVALADVTLTGSDGFTRRGVTLQVAVDDVDASALGVVSQGSSSRSPWPCSCPGRWPSGAPSGSSSSTTPSRPWTPGRSRAWPGC